MKKLFLVIFFLSYTLVKAQIGGNSTYEFLNVPVSARVGALGGNLISVKDDDPSLALDNPSLLTSEMNKMLSLSYLNFFAGINQGYVSYIKDYGTLGTFSGGMKYINYGKFIETDEGGNVLGEFSAGEYALVLGWGKSIDSLFSVGANFKPIYSSLYQYSSFGVALDLSGTYYNPTREFTIAAVIKNFGTQLKPFVQGNREPLPLDFQLGISKRLKHVPLRLSLIATNLNNWGLSYNDSISITNSDNLLSEEEKKKKNRTNILDETVRHFIAGVEFVPTKTFNIRIGFNYRRRAELALNTKPGIVGFSWGVGFKVKKFHISYGSARYHLAGTSNHLTIMTNLSEYYSKKDTNSLPKEKKKKKGRKKEE